MGAVNGSSLLLGLVLIVVGIRVPTCSG